SCLYHSPSSPSIHILVLCLFSFQRYGAHPDLPSFPTRRSSDLIHDSVRIDVERHLDLRPAARGGRDADEVELPQELVVSRHFARSEEHTSELQSPDHLVCRLLLEKKKKTKINILQ